MLTSKLEAAQAGIRRRWDPHFEWLIHDAAPWSPLEQPLSQSSVALVSTCGLYCADTQIPFDAWDHLGDPSFREIPVDTPRDRLRIAHTHYNHQHVAADLNVALPIDHFERLVEQGVVARLAPRAYSFMGYLPEPHQLVDEFAPAVARRMRSDGVDIAFLTPC